MQHNAKEQSVDDLLDDAKASLVDLLEFSEVRTDQWFMHLYTDGGSGIWEPLSNDADTNNSAIRSRIHDVARPVTALSLAFCGMAEVEGSRQMVAYTQYFRKNYNTGLVLGRRIGKAFFSGKLKSHGSFLIMGNCQNIWI